MNITFYHHIPLPVKTYGGTERILFWHMCELVRLGHTVNFIGHPDSKVEEFGINLIPVDPSILRSEKWKSFIPKETDIVHLQFNFNEEINHPIICTTHGNGKIGEVFHHNSVFVSGAHANLHNSSVFVYNGFNFDEYPRPNKWPSENANMLFLAKASWRVKNLKDCKRVAKTLKKHLHIAGGKSFSLSRYIHNHGFIGGEEKLELMRSCDSMLFPVRWHEPFGMAMVEAMTQGLPIFGSCYGSLPEVIGEAGVAAKNFDEFQEAVKNYKVSLSPEQIREYALESFNINKYSLQYIELYNKVVNGENLNNDKPSYSLDSRAEDLLPF